MAEAIFGLVGAVVGAAIAGAVAVMAIVAEGRRAKRNQRDMFRLAALDKRLEAHQTAYTLWRNLIAAIHHPEKRSPIVLECQEWWFKNCLYLEPKARKAFWSAFSSAWFYDGKDEEMRKQAWPEIMGAGEIIASAVDLPPIGDLPQKLEKMDKTHRDDPLLPK